MNYYTLLPLLMFVYPIVKTIVWTVRIKQTKSQTHEAMESLHTALRKQAHDS